jgi:hypothetical protein
MPAARSGVKRRLPLKLDKQFVGDHEGYRFYTVNTFAVRDTARPDEEFGNFATKEEFPTLIPDGEVWLSNRAFRDEGLFFIADAVTRLKELEKGTPEATAYTAGLNAERRLREKVTGLKYRGGKPHRRVPERVYVEPYLTLPDVKFPVNVWRVDGSVVRCFYKTDYTEGGHGYVYAWVPRGEIWIEKALDRREVPFILAHEYTELRLMRDEGLDYATAHEISAKLEYRLRQGKGALPLLTGGERRKLGKKDLPRLTTEEYFAYVRRTYLKK